MKKKYRIGVIPGDGIGRDVIQAAQIVLETVNGVSKAFSLEFLKMDTGDSCGCQVRKPLPPRDRGGDQTDRCRPFRGSGEPQYHEGAHGVSTGV